MAILKISMYSSVWSGTFMLSGGRLKLDHEGVGNFKDFPVDKLPKLKWKQQRKSLQKFFYMHLTEKRRFIPSIFIISNILIF